MTLAGSPVPLTDVEQISLFLAGRYVANAERESERRLGTLALEERVRAYDGASGKFVELREDGLRVLNAMHAAGSLGTLLDGIDPALPGAERSCANLERFATELHRLGVLTPGRPTHTEVTT